MTLFDTVFFKCPKCGKSVNFSSRSGPMLSIKYHQSEVPLAIAGELLKKTLTCEGCQNVFYVRAVETGVVSLELSLEKPSDYWYE